jgi:hypothetical protein
MGPTSKLVLRPKAGRVMAKQKYSPDGIIARLRAAGVYLSQGMTR